MRIALYVLAGILLILAWFAATRQPGPPGILTIYGTAAALAVGISGYVIGLLEDIRDAVVEDE